MPNGILNVKDFGAKGVGTDDRVPIQHAIIAAYQDQVKSVFFPPGSYGLSVVPGENYMLDMRPNVRLFSLHHSMATLKVLDGQPNYRHILYQVDNGTPHDNVEVIGLTIDQNRNGNPIASENDISPAWPRRGIGMWNGDNLRVSRCRFVNFETYNHIMLSGLVSNVRVTENVFEDINGSTPWHHDFSSIYVKMLPGHRGAWVEKNYIVAGSPGRSGAITGIDVAGDGFFMHKNYVEDLQNGIIFSNALGQAETVEGAEIESNRALRCLFGIRLQSNLDENFTVGPGLRDIRVAGNLFNIDLDPWMDVNDDKYGRGIYIHPNNDAHISGLTVSDNTVRFEDYSHSAVDPFDCYGLSATHNPLPEIDKGWMILSNLFHNIPRSEAVYMIRIDPSINKLMNRDNMKV